MNSPRVHTVTFSSGEEKARYLGERARLDSEFQRVASLAQRVAGAAESDTEAIEDVFAWVQRRIAYVRDPGWTEQFADSNAILTRGFDDCDGKSRLIVAMLTALARDVPARRGIEAVIDAVFRDGEFDHVQVLARGRGTETHPKATRGGWLLLDATLAGVGVGDGAEAAHVDPYTRDVATT